MQLEIHHSKMRRGGSARPGCHPDTKKSKQKIITWLRGAHLTSPLRTTGASDIQKGPGTRGGGEARGAGLVSLLLLLAALLAALVGGRVAALGRRRGREPRGLFPGGGGGGGGGRRGLGHHHFGLHHLGVHNGGGRNRGRRGRFGGGGRGRGAAAATAKAQRGLRLGRLKAGRGRSGGIGPHLRCHLAADEDRQRGCDDVVGHPVDPQAGRDVDGEPADHEGQHLQNGLALFLLRGEVLGLHDLGGNVLGYNEDDRDGQVQERISPTKRWDAVYPAFEQPSIGFSRGCAKGGPFQRWYPKKGLVQPIFSSQVEQCTIQRDKDWDLHQCRDAAGQGVYLVGLVKLCNFLVCQLWVVGILGLELFDLWSNSLHLCGGLQLGLGERICQSFDKQCESNDGNTV
mmetsp:Transcript_46247/g.72354  ORF Transcript_46247/g.72354 Transcript_46247/m.72354 type:complete len:400 (-) Transcript_46247:43-1242(-)